MPSLELIWHETRALGALHMPNAICSCDSIHKLITTYLWCSVLNTSWEQSVVWSMQHDVSLLRFSLVCYWARCYKQSVFPSAHYKDTKSERTYYHSFRTKCTYFFSFYSPLGFQQILGVGLFKASPTGAVWFQMAETIIYNIGVYLVFSIFALPVQWHIFTLCLHIDITLPTQHSAWNHTFYLILDKQIHYVTYIYVTYVY